SGMHASATEMTTPAPATGRADTSRRMVMEERIERFLAALGRDRGFSPNTVSAYRNDLSQFCHFLCEQHALQSWAELTGTILTNYVLYLRERGYANATVARKLAAVKSFCHRSEDRRVRKDNQPRSLAH